MLVLPGESCEWIRRVAVYNKDVKAAVTTAIGRAAGTVASSSGENNRNAGSHNDPITARCLSL
jgi:hypothetical protein